MGFDDVELLESCRRQEIESAEREVEEYLRLREMLSSGEPIRWELVK